VEVGTLGLPAELLPRPVARSDQDGRVARAPWRHHVGDGMSGDLTAGLDHLADREPRAVAEVVDTVFADPSVVEREQVGVREVGHVDVVTDGRAVLGRVVVAVDLHAGAVPGGHLQHNRNEVGFGGVPFPEAPIGARDVEVPQAHRG
jgi:hypothetical protein